MSNASAPRLSVPQILVGHEAVLTAATRLLGAGSDLLVDYPEIAIGLFQLGQEEIGKSFSLLAAFSYVDEPNEVWETFWREWRDHERKAARSFFYEWLSPVRLVTGDEKTPLDGRPVKKHRRYEKEAAFYVNFDRESGQFVSPQAAIGGDELASRVASMTSHLVVARQLEQALDDGDREWNYGAFSEIPARILSEFIRQEAMAGILDEFSRRSSRHAELVGKIRTSLTAGSAFLRSELARLKARQASTSQEP